MRVGVTDTADNSTQTITSPATVSDAALSATETNPPPLQLTRGTPFSGYLNTFTDADGNGVPADYSSTVSWGDGTATTAGTNSGSGNSFSVSGSHTYTQTGIFSIQVVATDVGGASVTSNLTAVVSNSSLSVRAANLALTEGTFTSPVTVATFSDSDGNTSPSYSANIQWGDGQSSGGMVTSLGGGAFSVSASHAYNEEGPFLLGVSITDSGDNASATASGTATVADAALTAGTNNRTLQLSKGKPFSGSLGSFQDADVFAAQADYTSTVNWGDGTPTTSGSVAGSGTSFTVSGSHTYAEPGLYNVLVTSTDAGGASVTFRLTASVSSSFLSALVVDPTLTEGTAGSPVTVATFSDSDANTLPSAYGATVSWGDGSSSPGMISGGSGGFSVQASHLYADEGSYLLGVSIGDGDGAAASVTGTAFVLDAALRPGAGSSLQTPQGKLFSGTLATFSDGNPSAPATDFTALVNWGDGSTPATASVSGSGGNYSVSGSHVWTQTGLYTVTLDILDEGGSQASVSDTMMVTPPPLTVNVSVPSLTEGIAALNGTVATFSDSDGNNSNPASYAATVTWGDGSSSAGTIGSGGGGFSMQASHTYAEEGNFSVSVSVGDQDGASGTGQGTATVADAALSGTGTPVQAVAGTPFEGAVGTFSDADPGAAASDYNAVITWGDNSTPTDGAVAVSGSSFQINGGHTYASAGSYSLSISLTDQGGATTTFTSTATVAPPPQTLSPPTANAIEGRPFQGNVCLFTPANPALSGDAYQIEIGWGDGGVSGGALTSNGAGSFWVSGGHTYAEETATGYPYTLTITITGPGGPLDASGTATVSDASLGATAGPAVTAFTNAPTGSVLLGRFSDGNPGAPANDFSGTVDWGDSTTSTGAVAVDAQGGFDVFGGHTYTASGTYTVQVVVGDEGGQGVTLNGTATVTTLTAQLSAIEGTRFNGVVASFAGDPTQATGGTIVWGDGSSSMGTVTATGSSGFTVAGNHTYSEENTYDLGVSVSLANGGGLGATGPATVADAALSVLSGPNLTAVAGAPLGATGPVLLAHFADANPGAPLSDYSASIQWGDGDVETGLVQVDAHGGIDVYGNHVYGDAGGYVLEITLTDVGGSWATAYGAVTVDLAEGQTYSAALLIHPARGTQLSWGTTYTAQIDWGDGTISPAVAALASDLVDLEVFGDHVYPEEGSYTITATVADPAGLGGTATSGVVIGDAVLKSSKEAFTVVAGTPYNGPVGGFSDANGYATPSDFTAAGSGSTVTGGDGSFAVNGSFTFATPGTYQLSTSVGDDGGAGVMVKSTVTVVPPWTVPVDSSGNGDTRGNDPQAAFLKSIGEATVDLNQGAVRVSQALDFDQSQ